MAKKIVLVCDVCESEDGVKSYEVRSEGRKAPGDLCKEHGKPLEEVLKRAPKSTTTRRPRGTQTRATTMEEIEQLKNKG